MDTFTQAALGAAIGQAAFSRKLGRHAVWVGALLGALPDADVISGAFGPWASMVHHRGATHSLLFAPVMAPLFGWAAYRLLERRGVAAREPRDRRQLVRWMHLAFWALITHPLLDWCTSYGTQLLWPLSNERFAIDAVMIVDPIYSLTLAAALVVGWIYRRRLQVGQLAGWVGLVLTTGYLTAGYAESQRAERLASAQLRAEGFAPVQVRAQPSMLLWMWRIVARDDDGNLRVGALSTWRPTPIRFAALERPDDPLVERALQSERGQIFTWFADDMVGVRVQQQGDRTKVVLEDQRYGLVTRPTQAFWGAVAEFDRQGRLLAVERYNDRPREGMRTALAATWKMMWEGVERSSPPATGRAKQAERREVPAHADSTSPARAAL